MTRRGTARSIWSDNGTNFVGARNELRQVFKEMKHEHQELLTRKWSRLDSIARQPTWYLSYGKGLRTQNSIWKNYFGGFVEDQQSSFEWWITQNIDGTHNIEHWAYITSRPLTVETISGSKSEIPLLPSNLLTMKTSVLMPPPGEFSKLDVYSKRRWWRVQHIAGEFWSRLRKEFLQSLQVRQIWKKRIRNFAAGDIFLLRDDCHWNQ